MPIVAGLYKLNKYASISFRPGLYKVGFTFAITYFIHIVPRIIDQSNKRFQYQFFKNYSK